MTKWLLSTSWYLLNSQLQQRVPSGIGNYVSNLGVLFVCLLIAVACQMKWSRLRAHVAPTALIICTQAIKFGPSPLGCFRLNTLKEKKVQSLCVDSRPVFYIVHELVCYVVFSIVWCIFYYFSVVFSHQLTVICSWLSSVIDCHLQLTVICSWPSSVVDCHL